MNTQINPQVDRIIAEALQLSSDEQQIILDRLQEQREWKALISKPEAKKAIRELAKKALEEETEEGGFDGSYAFLAGPTGHHCARFRLAV